MVRSSPQTEPNRTKKKQKGGTRLGLEISNSGEQTEGVEARCRPVVAVFAASVVIRRWSRRRLTPNHDFDGISPRSAHCHVIVIVFRPERHGEVLQHDRCRSRHRAKGRIARSRE